MNREMEYYEQFGNLGCSEPEDKPSISDMSEESFSDADDKPGVDGEISFSDPDDKTGAAGS